MVQRAFTWNNHTRQRTWLCVLTALVQCPAAGCSVKISLFQQMLPSQAPLLTASLVSGSEWESAVVCLPYRERFRAAWLNYQGN